jgi:hypothetical protein
VLLLTTSDRYDGHADKVLVLPAPTERDEYEPRPTPQAAETISMWSSAPVTRTAATARKGR